MEQKGSFIGFSFGNRHSSTLGILRTSSSDRYEISIAPQAQDITTELSSRDGQYYWGSSYTKREIPISFAFYGMTEIQTSLLKRIYNDKKIHPLILDEEPHKVWSAKLSSQAIVKHLCFELNDERFYSGEGTFTFTVYYPYARSRYQYFEDYTEDTIPEWLEGEPIFSEWGKDDKIYPAILEYGFEEDDDTGFIIGKNLSSWIKETELLIDSDVTLDGVNSVVEFFSTNPVYKNLDEWYDASNIPKRSDGYGSYADGKYKLFNAGDVEICFKIYFPVNTIAQNFEIVCADRKILLKDVVAKDNDKYIVLDGFSQTIQGCDELYQKTKNLYNNKIIDGGLFKLPIGEIELITNQPAHLEFNYLYL